jgi:hypothetical protein
VACVNDSLLSRFEATEAKVSKKRYVVKLSAGERKRLEELIRKGKSLAKKQLKARILLRADESPLGPKWNDPKISEALGTYREWRRPWPGSAKLLFRLEPRPHGGR